MVYVLIAAVIVAALVLFIWLRQRVKAAVVQPVDRNGMLLPALLSEKKRLAAIREKYDLLTGFIVGACFILGVGYICGWWR